MKLLVFLLIAAVLPAQDMATVTFAQTGLDTLKSLTGVKIKGVGVLGVEICSTAKTPVVLPSQRVYQIGLSRGVPLISALAVPSILTKATNANPYTITADVGGQLAGIAAILTASKIVASPWALTTGLLVASAFYNQFRPLLSSKIPSTSVVANDLLKGDLAIQASACVSKLALARYKGDVPPVTVAIPLN